MWYFTWILGVGFALAAGIINVMWLETYYAFDQSGEETSRTRFERAKRGEPLK